MNEQFLTQRNIAEKISSVGCTNIFMQARGLYREIPSGCWLLDATVHCPHMEPLMLGFFWDVIMKVQGKRVRLN